MWPIEYRSTPFRAVVKEVLRNLWTRICDVCDSERFVVVTPISAETVVRANQQSTRKPFIEFDEGSMVFRLGSRFDQGAGIPIWIQSAGLCSRNTARVF